MIHVVLRCSRWYCTNISKKMSVLTQEFNPITGKTEWEVKRDDYDYQQEIARSAYADMLHDFERNMKYHNALKSAIDAMRKRNLPVKVLDIGTGSGLLAMMAARYGADSVYACEAFKAIAVCATNVISDNKLSDKINLIGKRSTELTVGENGDLPEKANILVTEVFDTELIGEGALSTFKHALQNLLTEDCIVVPSSATVYAQVVESRDITSMHHIPDLKIPGIPVISTPESVKCCAGAPAVHDIQLSQLDPTEFKILTKPAIVKKFDFTGKSDLKVNDSADISIPVIASGTAEVVFMWWEIEMYPGGEILSCAPKWAHPDGPHNLPWRDHWMQAAYYLPQCTTLTPDDPFNLGVHHDEYSFWFTANKSGSQVNCLQAPICTCGVHITNSRSRIGMITECDRFSSYVVTLKDIDSRDQKVIFICGESIPLVLIACKLGFKKVFLCETQPTKVDIINAFIKCNDMENQVTIIRKEVGEVSDDDIGNCKLDVVLAEPFFSTSVVQWDNLHFWYLCESLKKHLHPDAILLPRGAVAYGVAVEFQDLWKIRAPVKAIEGFDLASFDKVIQRAIGHTDAPIEPQPLWEYAGIPLSQKFELCRFDFTEPLPISTCTYSGSVDFNADGKLNGIAIWVEFILNEHSTVSLGPLRPLDYAKHIEWYKFCQQGVYLFDSAVDKLKDKTLSFSTKFSSKSGKMVFDFQTQ